MFSNSLVLENEQLILKPSTIGDLNGLDRIAHASIWEHSSTSIRNRQDMKLYLLKANEERSTKLRQQLTIIKKANNEVVGCSSFEHISEIDRRLEIGWTWLGKQFQGKGYNKVAKFLMLECAFNYFKYERVEFRTRGSNIQSQKALMKIGATREGTLRSYFINEGSRHDMVYFSILGSEWPHLRTTIFKELLF